MNRILLILFLLFTNNYCFGQSDTAVQRDSIYILVDGVITNGNNFGAEYGSIMTRCNPNITLNDSTKNLKDTIGEPSDGKKVKINIRKSTSHENIIIVDGVVTTNPITSWDNWYITNSIGFAPEESKPVFYVAVQTTNDNTILYGLTGGIYTYEKDLDDAVNEFLQSLGPLNAGQYTVIGNFATTRTPTYIGALSGGYRVSYYLTFDASFGFQCYRNDTYYGVINFSVPANGTPLPEGSISPDMPFYIVESKDIVKAYYSLGAKYRLGTYTKVGVFADNIYSFGANISLEF